MLKLKKRIGWTELANGYRVSTVLIVGLMVVLTLGASIALMSKPANTYKGPPVAGFTTGGMACSPICGHDNADTHH